MPTSDCIKFVFEKIGQTWSETYDRLPSGKMMLLSSETKNLYVLQTYYVCLCKVNIAYCFSLGAAVTEETFLGAVIPEHFTVLIGGKMGLGKSPVIPGLLL